MKISVQNENHFAILQTLATIANKTSRIEDNVLIVENTNREHSSNVTKTRIDHEEPLPMRCLGVPGQSFFIKSENRISVTGNTLHVNGVSWLFKTICREHPSIVTDAFKTKIYDMVRTMVDLEDKYIDLVFDDYNIEGMEKEDVKTYIRFIADRRLTQIGLKPNYKIKKNPLEWLEWSLGGVSHTNFFEDKVADYEVAGFEGEDWDYSARISVETILQSIKQDMAIMKKEQEKKTYKVYSRKDCPYCVQAKDMLSDRGFDYEEISLDDYDLRQKFYDDKGFSERTVPKIYEITNDGETFIGGFRELTKHLH